MDMLDMCREPGCGSLRWKSYRTCFRHTPARQATLRRVWATISAKPRLSVRELAKQAGCTTEETQRALHQLVSVGAIEHQEGTCRAWHIVEPFSWVDWP